MPRLIPIVILFVLVCFPVSIIALTERELNWPDLVKRIEFEDPFEKLSSEQIVNLSLYARIQLLQQSAPERVSEAMNNEALEAEQSLRDQGIDIEGLLARRDEIKELRKQQAIAVVPELHEQQVRMPGFALPLEMTDRMITEFLLVPWVGACIHTPPPPPNQIVYVVAKDGFENQGQFSPVWVTGEMKVQSSTKDLFLVDGSAGISTGYTLFATEVKPYKQ